MIKIQYDHQIFSAQRYGGISRYFANLQQALDENEGFSYHRGIIYTQNYYLKHKIPSISIINTLLKQGFSLRKLNKWYARYIVHKSDFDLFHPTYYHPYFLDKLKKPFVLTVHDMIHELFPSYFPQNDPYVHFKRILIEKADHIIAISESAKKDLLYFFKIPENKISVVYHGYQNNGIPVEVNYSPPVDNYILYVGDRSRYKNFKLFISAMMPLLKNRKYVKIICLGGNEFGDSEKKMFHHLRINMEQIHQFSVTEGQLNQFYKKALLFVYPSLYEGFGLPLLEAFANNCPVAVSNTSCFGEVGGNAVIYFNPYDPDDIRNKVESVINNSQLANQLRLKGAEQLKKFSFEKCSEKTLKVYKTLT